MIYMYIYIYITLHYIADTNPQHRRKQKGKYSYETIGREKDLCQLCCWIARRPRARDALEKKKDAGAPGWAVRPIPRGPDVHGQLAERLTRERY